MEDPLCHLGGALNGPFFKCLNAWGGGGCRSFELIATLYDEDVSSVLYRSCTFLLLRRYMGKIWDSSFNKI